MSKKVAAGALAMLPIAAAAGVTWGLGRTTVAVVLLGLLVAAVGFVALDTNQQVRRQGRLAERRQKETARRLTTLEELAQRPPQEHTGDVVGTVKLLQEQYLGRLDRSQSELEHATAALRDAVRRSTAPTKTE